MTDETYEVWLDEEDDDEEQDDERERAEDDWEPAYRVFESDARSYVDRVRGLTKSITEQDQRAFADAIGPYERVAGASLAQLLDVIERAEALLQKYDPSAARW